MVTKFDNYHYYNDSFDFTMLYDNLFVNKDCLNYNPFGYQDVDDIKQLIASLHVIYNEDDNINVKSSDTKITTNNIKDSYSHIEELKGNCDRNLQRASHIHKLLTIHIAAHDIDIDNIYQSFDIYSHEFLYNESNINHTKEELNENNTFNSNKYENAIYLITNAIDKVDELNTICETTINDQPRDFVSEVKQSGKKYK